jgi:hypothetical protein
VIFEVILRFFLSGKLRLWGFEGGSESDVAARCALRIVRALARRRHKGVNRTHKISPKESRKKKPSLTSEPYNRTSRSSSPSVLKRRSASRCSSKISQPSLVNRRNFSQYPHGFFPVAAHNRRNRERKWDSARAHFDLKYPIHSNLTNRTSLTFLGPSKGR